MLDLYNAFWNNFTNLQIVYLNKTDLLITKKYFGKDFYLINLYAKN